MRKGVVRIRYFSVRRPVAPGTYPKPTDNIVLGITNFSGKEYCEEIGREAWGFVDYEVELREQDADMYELVLANKEKMYDS